MKILLLTSDFDGPGVGYDVKFSQSVLNEKFTTYVFHFGKRNEPEKNIYSFDRKKIFQSYKLFKKNYISQKIDLVHIRGIISFAVGLIRRISLKIIFSLCRKYLKTAEAKLCRKFIEI